MQDKALVTDSHHQNIEKKDAISEIGLIYLDIFFFYYVLVSDWIYLTRPVGTLWGETNH